MATLGDSNVPYKAWLESFEQIIAEIRPPLSAVVEFVRAKKSERVTKEVFMAEFTQSSTSEAEILWEKANNGLWTLLLFKTSGTAKLKLKNAEGPWCTQGRN